jgi:ribosomal protein S1
MIDYQAFVFTMDYGLITIDCLKGKINKIVSFGLFIELLNCPFIGFIGIGHFAFNGREQLPINFSSWAKEGDNIKCIVSYFRFENRQIGLGWLPDETK